MRHTLQIANESECELIAVYRRLSTRQRRAVMRFFLRHTNGVPFPISLARLRAELVQASSGRPA